jgi:hypothetical protein
MLTQVVLPHCLQDIALKLTDVLRSKVAGTDLKVRALHGLSLFLSKISAEAGHLKEQLPFLVWFCTTSVLHLFEGKQNKDVIKAAAHVLRDVVALAVDNDVASFGRILAPVKNAVSDHVTSRGGARDKCLEIVDLLLKGCEAQKSIEVMRIDSFPRSKTLESFQKRLDKLKPHNADAATLDSIMENFLGSPSAESTTTLQKALQTRPVELAALIADLGETRGLSEDASKSLLHRVVHKLSEVASAMVERNPTLSTVAARCLGRNSPMFSKIHFLCLLLSYLVGLLFLINFFVNLCYCSLRIRGFV